MGRMAAPVMACRINSASTVYPIRAGLVSYLCKLLIQKNRTDGLQDKMDVYLAADRLTPEEYQELAGLLAPEQ